MMKILVLGGTGFVGKNVCEVLKKNKISYYIASRSEGTDLRLYKDCKKALLRYKPDYIVNCAAHVGSLNYVTAQAANVVVDNTKMIVSLYEAIASVCPKVKVIHPIANCAYPGNLDTYIEDSWWSGHLHRSVLSYGVTKRLLWAIGECFQMQHGIRSIYLLVPNMYGPYDSTDPNKAHAFNAIVSKFVSAHKLNTKKVTIWGSGIAIREWLFARDFGRIILEIIKKPNMLGLNEPINIAQNFGIDIKELVDLIKKYFPQDIRIHYDTSMPEGALRKVMDDGKFRKFFPKFQFTSFEKGIKETVDYYKSKYNIV